LIVVLGEPLVDLFALPRGSGLADAESFRPFPGGAPLNVALVLGRSGNAVRFIGAVGADGHGDRLLAEMESAGIDARCVVRTTQKTGLCFIASEGGSRRFLGYADSGAEYALAWDAIAALDPLAGARWLAAGSGSLTTEPMASSLWRALDEAAARSVPVLVDLNVRRHLWSVRERMIGEAHRLAARATLLGGSEDDLVALGLPPTLAGMATLAPAAVRWVTHAERGAELEAFGRRYQRAADAVAVVDATGAGDAFTAGLLHAVARAPSLRDVDWEEALATGCGFGARAVTAVGCSSAFR
jgi:fructokinase